MQRVLQVDELGHLAFHHLADGHARPAAHDVGDILRGDLLLEQTILFLRRLEHAHGLLELGLELGDPAKANFGCRHEVTLARATVLVHLGLVDLGLYLANAVDGVFLVGPLGAQLVELLLLLGDLSAQLLETLLGELVVFLHERLLLDLHLREHAIEQVDLLGARVDLHAQAASCLVYQVDGLVGQESVRDVAVGELGRRHDGSILDAHAVMDLILLLDATQNRDRLLDGGLADHDGLEPALERGILFDVLAVLVERGRADGMKLPARECRLEHVARIERSLARAGAHDRMQLVDEQDDVAVRLLDLA